MLKQRLITAAVLIPIFILLVLKLSPILFCLLTGLFVVIAAYEWSGLMGVKRFPQVLIYPVIVIWSLIISLYLYIPMVMYISFAWWIFASALVILYPRASQFWGKSIVLRGIMGLFVLVPAWLALNFIRQVNGPYALIFLFVLIWGADSAAYFVGKEWGKHKLASEVSPGKTWEGFAGALFATIIIAVTVSLLLNTPAKLWISVIILSLVTVIFSVMGDLFESMLKRKEKIKDSGVFFPGHGGVLDRIDSLTSAAPIFVLCGIFLQKFYH